MTVSCDASSNSVMSELNNGSTSTISIILCQYPNKDRYYKIPVSRDGVIKDLKRYLHHGDFIFFYKSNLLNLESKFSFYDIKDNDFIITTQENRKISVKSLEVFEEKLSNLMNPRTILDVMKIRDSQIAKLERRPRTYRKMCGAVCNSNRYCRINRGTPTSNIDLDSLEWSFSDPLSAFW